MLLENTPLSKAALKHFGLPRSPFVDDVQSRADVFQSTGARYARAALMDAAQNHGFVALVGESGAGKTTLIDELQERIDRKKREIAELVENQRRFKTDADFVEKIARQNHRVLPGELVFIFEKD